MSLTILDKALSCLLAKLQMFLVYASKFQFALINPPRKPWLSLSVADMSMYTSSNITRDTKHDILFRLKSGQFL